MPVKTVKKKNLEDTLKNLNKQTLLSIVLEFAGRDRRIKEELFLRYAEKEDTVKSARGVIKSAITAVKHRGYIEYRDTSRATDGADTVLQMIGDKIDSNDIQTAVSLSVVVLEEMMDLLSYCDDSDGIVGSVIYEAIEKIGEAVECIEDDKKGDEKIFDAIFNHAQNSIYNGWANWRMDLLSATVSLCGNNVNRNKIEQFICERQNEKTDEWLREYEIRELQKLQYELTAQYNKHTHT
jgi:hypothetical protein